MNPNAIEAISAISAGQASIAPEQTAAAAPGFATWMEQGLANLNTQLVAADQGVQKLASGNAENLHEVMLQLEQARLAMQVAAQVRSRIVEAYQEVMRMQV